VDYEAIARELVRALRGKRSQAACARRLRLRSNVLHAWEHGERYPSLRHFDALVRIAGRDLSQAFASLSKEERGGAALPRGRTDQGARWLRELAAGRPISELADAMERNRNTVARWLSGVTEPRLPDLLRFVHTTTLRLLEFLGRLVDPRALASVRKAHRDLLAQRRLAYDMPWSHAVLRALELEPYRALSHHEPGFIAKRLGLPREVEASCLRALAAAGQIRKSQGKWHAVRVLAVDTRVDPARNLELKRHWTRAAAERLERGVASSEALYSYNLFAISEEGLAKIRALHLAYYQQVRAVVEACQQPTRVVLTNVQLVPLDG
jgi:transcriptional regulator with XRE-family HTH domain